jgi:putative aldouronate transport system permease protein
MDFTIASYKLVFVRKEFWESFGVSVERTILSVFLNTVLTILLAYPLSISAKVFKGRNIFMWMLIFVMVFSGGLVPLYLLVYKLGLIDSIWSLVLPGAVPIFNVILMMNFIRSQPKSIQEAAFIDRTSSLLSKRRCSTTSAIGR